MRQGKRIQILFFITIQRKRAALDQGPLSCLPMNLPEFIYLKEIENFTGIGVEIGQTLGLSYPNSEVGSPGPQ